LAKVADIPHPEMLPFVAPPPNPVPIAA